MSESAKLPKSPSNIYLGDSATYSSILEHVNKTIVFWRWCTFVSLLVIFLMGISLVQIASRSNTVPLLIAMDENRIPHAVYQPEVIISIDDPRIVGAALAQFVISMRSVSSDIEFQRRRRQNLLLCVSKGSPASAKVRALIPDAVTIAAAHLQEHTVSIQVTKTERLSKRVWQVTWHETVYALDGSVSARATWQSDITFEFLGKVDAKIALVNPIGLLVTDFSLLEVSTATDV